MGEHPLLGTWRLVSYIARDEQGSISHPFGEEVEGFINYSVDGRMSVQFARANRPALSIPEFKSADTAKVVNAVSNFIAYAGTYEIHDDKVIHHLDLSLIPNWIGQDFVRTYVLDGDRITLSTPPVLIDGRMQVGILTWQRI